MFRVKLLMVRSLVVALLIPLFFACSKGGPAGLWDYEVDREGGTDFGVMKIITIQDSYQVELHPWDREKIILNKVALTNGQLTGEFELFETTFVLSGRFQDTSFLGELKWDDGDAPFVAQKQSEEKLIIDRSHLTYHLSQSDLPESEHDIDHKGIIANLNHQSLVRGSRIYNSNCINCHGNPDMEGSIPLSTKFWEQPLKAGSDAYSMYQTITRGYGSMPPQPVLTPREKYDVIVYIQQRFIRSTNRDQYFGTNPGYLAGLPEGSSMGPEVKPYHPWSDMDYGNFFINTYELVDEETGPERYHSPGPAPFPDEDYRTNNFAYKGIAVRLDKGAGGVSDGNTWMMFDHDVMRVAGGWSGEGFIDWDGILLNDRHETYPRTIGKLHFETPVGPGWANPETGSFEDPRFRARDGRAFGPLPKKWADYKGLYYHGDDVIISYTVGASKVLEKPGMEMAEGQVVFTRTLNISPSASILKLRVAAESNRVAVSGAGGSLSKEDGQIVLKINGSKSTKLKLFIADSSFEGLDSMVETLPPPESLAQYTRGGPSHYPQVITSAITKGADQGILAVDKLIPPFSNPWDCRMKLSGLDFMSDPNKAVVCSTDGDIWLISGLTDQTDSINWKRIGSGLFQPLGIKVINDRIFVTCRDQIVMLHDLNGDEETDFYESFNHDHQVTDHFHEFAMGLQADKMGNLYYAKSGRHAREALIPQHGTLIKVSKNGKKSEIIASGFRAANGVCINPDGGFIVTDQQGFWNPMNRINWIEGSGKFYGNMWGYNPPEDTSRAAMEPPMVWVDMEFDRSPSELIWVDSKQWGPLNGSLLSFSYGFGKIQLVLHEKVNGQKQGGVIDIPGVKFMTGVMRGRFNPQDGHLYACGMSAWGTNQLMRGGGLYRLRYTGKPLTTPIGLKAREWGVTLSFASLLDPESTREIDNYSIETWDLVRSSAYGSDRFNRKTLNISQLELTSDGKSVKIFLDDLEPVDVMTISYNLTDKDGNLLQGTVQNTIHNLGNGSITLNH